MATSARWRRPLLAHWPVWARGRWRYAENGPRDERLDLLRGCLIVAMLVDHLGGASWWYAVTGGNAFYVSAAEGFVFLSGLVMGIVYARLIAREGLRAATRRAVRRAATLYGLALGLSVAFYAASSLAGASWSEPLANLPLAAFQSATLRRSDYLADVLMLYALLVLAAPVALALLARGRTALVLVGSASIWALHQVGITAPVDAVLGGPEAFRPLAWQVIFVAGLAGGWHWRRIEPLTATRRGTVAMVAFGAVAAALITLAVIAPHTPLADPVAAIFAKDGLRGGRLLAAIVFFPVLFAIVTHAWRPLHDRLGWLLLPLGRRALPAYALHLFIILGAHVWWPRIPGYSMDDPARNSAMQTLAVLGLWALVCLPEATRSLAPILARHLGAPTATRQRRLVAASSVAFATVAVSGLVALPVVAPTTAFAPAATPVAARDIAVRAPAAPTYVIHRAMRAATAAAGGAPVRAASPPTPGAALVAADARQDNVATIQEHEIFSAALGRTMAYWIYIPPAYRLTETRFPVLYLLHGMGGDRGEWMEYGALLTAQRLHAADQSPPMLIVLPEGEQSYWVNHTDGPRWGDYVATDLVDHIDATYRTQPTAAGRAIGGLSMGATAALTLALTYPERFDTVGLHSPSVRAADQAMPFLGVEEEFARRDLLTLIRTADTPPPQHLWIDIGADDGWVGSAEALHEALIARQIPHAWQVSPGYHDGDYWSAQVGAYLRFYGDALVLGRATTAP